MALRLATYNVHHGAPRGRVFPRHRELAAALDHLDADVVALQEVDVRTLRSSLRDQAALAARHLKATDHRFVSNHPWWPWGWNGNALLVRGQLLRVEVRSLPGSSARSSTRGRRAVFGRVRTADGTELSVVSTHLEQRRAEPGAVPPAVVQLRVLLDDLDRWPEPRVLLGDLNLDRDVAGDLLAEAGYTTVEAPPTVPSDLPHRHLDWIAGREIEVIEAAVPDLRASDHRPLIATVSLT